MRPSPVECSQTMENRQCKNHVCVVLDGSTKRTVLCPSDGPCVKICVGVADEVCIMCSVVHLFNKRLFVHYDSDQNCLIDV